MVVNQTAKWRNPKECIEIATTFLRDALERSDCNSYFLGLSGGIDSAVAASLAVNAVGKDKTAGLFFPTDFTTEAHHDNFARIQRQLSIEHADQSVQSIVDGFSATGLRLANIIARVRMIKIFDYASHWNGLVLGTGNRTEICLGYTTWYGDSACSVNPLAPFYKTEIRMMAKELGVPQEIIDAPPSAGLWEGQTDEDEIGVEYETIDNILFDMIEGRERSEKKLYADYGEKNVNRVVELLNKNYFKRHLPRTPVIERAIPDRIDLE